jgi:hypothetical protein
MKKRDDEDETRGRRNQQQQVRLYHASQRNEIAPFLPEIIVFAVIAGGWVAYRTGQGKPLTPDEALRAQEEYLKLEEKLRHRQQAREEEYQRS